MPPDPSIRKMMRAMIHRAIKDLGSEDMAHYASAKNHISEASFVKFCRIAEYPPELLDTLAEVMQRSRAERKILSQQLIEILRTQWDQTE